jgi:hypothetical protein
MATKTWREPRFFERPLESTRRRLGVALGAVAAILTTTHCSPREPATIVELHTQLESPNAINAPDIAPTELRLPSDIRDACQSVTPLPDSLALDNDLDGDPGALEPLGDCLVQGPLSGYEVHLFGSTELPGVVAAPVEGEGRADRIRSALTLLGVPVERIVTHDADGGAVVIARLSANPRHSGS